MDLQIELLEGALRKMREKGSTILPTKDEKYNIDMIIMALDIIKHCIENVNYIKSQVDYEREKLRKAEVVKQ